MSSNNIASAQPAAAGHSPAVASALPSGTASATTWDPKYKLNAERIKAVEVLCDEGATGIRQGADQLEVELLAMCLMQTDVIVNPQDVGFSDLNRDGIVGSGVDAMDLITCITDAGCSLEEMKNTTMEEEEPGCTKFQDLNAEMALNNPHMAPVTPGSIRFGSLAGGHTYQGFRAFHAGLEHPDERVTNGGCLSLQAVEAKDSVYASAIRFGIKCKVIKWQARKWFPRALQIISMARNMGKKAQAGEPDIQILRRMFNQAAATQARRGAPDWPMVRKFALQTLPKLNGNVEEYIYFLSRRSGGTDGAIFHYFAR